VAAAGGLVWETGFRVSRAAGGGFCGRVFLARVPNARDAAAPKPAVLAAEVEREPGKGPAGESRAEGQRMAGGEDLGTRGVKAERGAVGEAPSRRAGGRAMKSFGTGGNGISSLIFFSVASVSSCSKTSAGNACSLERRLAAEWHVVKA